MCFRSLEKKDNSPEERDLSLPPNSSPARLVSIDAARVLATFAIVWVHVAESHGQNFAWTSLGRFGTSYYVIVAALFAVRAVVRAPEQKFSADLRRRTQRLLWPFFIWSAVYGAYYCERGYRLDYTWAGLTQWWGPVAGTAVHLWFLPFAFVWGLFAVWFVPYLKRFSRNQILWGGSILSALLYYYCYRRLFFQLDRPWLWSWHLHRLDRWIVEVPLFITALFGSVYFYRMDQRSVRWLKEQRVILGTLALGSFVLVQALYAIKIEFIREFSDTGGRFMANIAGISLLMFSLAFNESQLVKKIAPLGRYTYLAFLSHMLVIEFFRAPSKNWLGYESLPFSLVEALLVFCVSMALSWLIQRVRFLSWLRA